MASDGSASASGPGPAPGNAPEAVPVPVTPEQAAFFDSAGRRARDCQDGLVPVTQDTVLGAMTQEHRAGLDMRLVGQEMDGPGKLGSVAGQVAARWREPGGVQVVFCDTGLHSAPGAQWSIRSELAGQLTGQLTGNGVPASAIRFPGETPSPGDVAELADGCRDGRISVLIGTTRDLARVPLAPGLLTAAHHLDTPLSAAAAARRAELQPQPAARARTFRYLTEGGTDAARWQALDAGRDPAQAAFRALTGRAVVTRRAAAAARPRARRVTPPRTGPGPRP